MRLLRKRKATRVFVDAKILNMHDQKLPKETYVGYFVEGSGLRDVERVVAEESDDAEILAVMFAMRELKDSLGRFVVVCDHESVVSEANRDVVKSPGELMRRLREMLRANQGNVKLVALQSNPAHQVVTEYVNALKAGVQ
jgi:hypothetical protein